MNDSRNPRAMDAEPSRTALQSHVAFFDPDSDGIIWPLDTYRGFRQIGSGILFSALCMVVIHSGFSWLTSRFPDPLFRIPISNIHKAIHGSDTGSYTQTGDLDLHRFDTVWEHNTQPPHTHMSFSEGVRMVRGDRNPFDVVRATRP
ncbi:unnamed protein product [Mycena citricolor]|uniref:Caleosin n=1 Tax=Mycena citricolor TaxID=2018698 RepID=A0AAD2HFY3_9AGAR|nr:unnamed protein product [Mycena citricolor]